MPRTIIVESYQEFAQRHGNDGLSIGKTGWILFSDGASVLQSDGDFREEPPTDPRELLILRRDYFREALKCAEKDFHRTQTAFADQAALASRSASIPSAPSNAAEILRDLAKVVFGIRGELERIGQQLHSDPMAEERRAIEYRKECDRQKANAAVLLSQIQVIGI